MEGVVVGAERRPDRGLAHGDVERVVVVARREHRATHLEQHEVEGGPEVLCQMRLDQSRPDGAEVVGEADADTGLLARLGLGVGACRRHGRIGNGRGTRAGDLDAGTAIVGAGGSVIGGGLPGGGVLRRHVLGLHQAVHDLERAVVADGDDAAGDGDVLGLEHGAGLDGVLDLREARLDRLRLLDQLVGPRVLVHVDELVVADVEPLDLGLLLVGGLGRRWMHPPEAREVGPVDVEASFGPLPAGRELVRRDLKAVEGELHQQRRVF